MSTLRQLTLVRSQQPENKYGPFVQEILKAEGLNGFAVHDLDTASLPDFRPDDVVILTRCLLTREEAGALHKAVLSGLRLVCLQSPWNLVQRFGWTPAKKVLHPGWVQIQESYAGAGTPLQTHVPIAAYEAQEPSLGHSVIAEAILPDWQKSGFPAVVRQKVGEGEIVFFFYDLPKAIARIRFGNPELASLLNNGHWATLHAFDLFEGHVDERVLHLPQADLQAQLFAKVLTDISPYPLARLWYYEKPEQRTAANFSSDDDGSTPEQFQDLSESLLERGGKATFYLMEETLLSDEEVERFRGQGHSFGPHVDALSPHEADYELGLTRQGTWYFNENWHFDFPQRLQIETQGFRQRYGAPSLSLQCHGGPWLGYMTWVSNFVENGYRLIFNYLSHPRWLNKYMCGAGLPLKFVDEDGTIYDCWQQPMHSFDEETLITRISENPDEVVQEFEAFLHPALERFYTAICVSSHPVSFSTYSKPFLEACFDRLQQENVPIYSGDEWCEFIDRRHAVQMQYSRTANGQLRLVLSNVVGAFSLMLPMGSATDNPEIYLNGELAQSAHYRRLEQDYLFVQLDGGTDREI